MTVGKVDRLNSQSMQIAFKIFDPMIVRKIGNMWGGAPPPVRFITSKIYNSNAEKIDRPTDTVLYIRAKVQGKIHVYFYGADGTINNQRQAEIFTKEAKEDAQKKIKDAGGNPNSAEVINVRI